MRYMSLAGTSRTATVWCPGPLANSLWVLDDETGAPLVVKVPRGDVGEAHETAWTVDTGRDVLAHWDGPWDYRPACWGGRWDRGALGGEPPWARAVVPPRAYFHDAPKLSEKTWRAAVGDQCTQLELIAA